MNNEVMFSTVREICAEIETQRYQTSFPASQVLEWRDRILAAYEREKELSLAICDKCEAGVFRNENERLRAALKPVLGVNIDAAIEHGVDCTELFGAIVKDAQRVYKEKQNESH